MNIQERIYIVVLVLLLVGAIAWGKDIKPVQPEQLCVCEEAERG